MHPRRRELLAFRTIGRNQGVLWQFVNEVVECHRKNNAARPYLYVYNDGWSYVEAYVPCLLDSVVLRAREKEQLLDDIARFTNSRQRYCSLGVPYHRGYLFYGPPGTGKTSLVSALAANFGLAIYSINLAVFNDRSLMNAVNQVAPGSVLLFEDIDCMKRGEARLPSHTRTNDG